MSSFARSLRAVGFLLFGLCFLLSARPARAQDAKKAECASAYEKSQEARASGKLRKAQEMLMICAQETCPAFVQTDCAQWLTEVQREIPTIIVSAKDAHGEDTAAVKVTMDGELLLKELDGKPVRIDPGVHKMRFEIDGTAPIEQQIVIRQSEKDRVVDISFAPRDADLPQDDPYAASKAETSDEDSAPQGPGPLRPYSYVAGGVGAAGIIGFVVLGAMGHGAESDLEKSGCKPNCPQSEVDSIKTKYLLADVSLGIGIAGLGTGVVLFFLSQPKAKKASNDDTASVKFDVRATPNAAFATVSGRF